MLTGAVAAGVQTAWGFATSSSKEGATGFSSAHRPDPHSNIKEAVRIIPATRTTILNIYQPFQLCRKVHHFHGIFLSTKENCRSRIK